MLASVCLDSNAAFFRRAAVEGHPAAFNGTKVENKKTVERK